MLHDAVCDNGEEVKKSEHFADVPYGSHLRSPPLNNGGSVGRTQICHDSAGMRIVVIIFRAMPVSFHGVELPEGAR